MKDNIQTLKLVDLEVHELAKLTPIMTERQFQSLKESIKEHGQIVPIVTYRGKIIDGRNRSRALRELGEEEIKVKAIQSNLSEEDVKDLILNVYENRRHQSPTQKAISAYKEYARLCRIGEKETQASIAERFGTTRKLLSRARELHGLAGDQVLHLLFNGGKYNIGTRTQPNNTDVLLSIINYFKKTIAELGDQGPAVDAEDFTDEEIASIRTKLSELNNEFSDRMLTKLNKDLHYQLQGGE